MSCSHPFAALALALALGAAGCGRPASGLRAYREVAVPPPDAPVRGGASVPGLPPGMGEPGAAGAMASAPVAVSGASLQWTAPAGWVEQPGQAVRLVTFLVGPDRAECTIVGFPGDVGGLEANLRRWLGQLKADVSDDALALFASRPESFTSEGGLDCRVFDFATILAPDAPASMLAAVVPLGSQTFFVKLAGSHALLAAEKDNFMALCRSLRP